MHLISAGKLKKAASKYPDVAITIKAFCKTIERAQWQSLIDVQQIYRDAEAVGNFTVFNIKGNKYRPILDIDIVNGKRSISKEQAKKLGEYFKISPSLFI
ncbi:MAG: type II toxin-antitoxin system HigB family toxin [Pleurocapsa sp. MO_226.B13]|nr:type II toxin-antitoxin system HigB family toxin [Pleurocapsa sp. MO_226.B13]